MVTSSRTGQRSAVVGAVYGAHPPAAHYNGRRRRSRCARDSTRCIRSVHGRSRRHRLHDLVAEVPSRQRALFGTSSRAAKTVTAHRPLQHAIDSIASTSTRRSGLPTRLAGAPPCRAGPAGTSEVLNKIYAVARAYSATSSTGRRCRGDWARSSLSARRMTLSYATCFVDGAAQPGRSTFAEREEVVRLYLDLLRRAVSIPDESPPRPDRPDQRIPSARWHRARALCAPRKALSKRSSARPNNGSHPPLENFVVLCACGDRRARASRRRPRRTLTTRAGRPRIGAAHRWRSVSRSKR